MLPTNQRCHTLHTDTQTHISLFPAAYSFNKSNQECIRYNWPPSLGNKMQSTLIPPLKETKTAQHLRENSRLQQQKMSTSGGSEKSTVFHTLRIPHMLIINLATDAGFE